MMEARLKLIQPAAILLLPVLAVSWWWTQRTSRDPLVVYCAQDSIYAEQLLTEFEQRTGIEVVIRFDTEANKSLGLVNLLIREKEHPRCDVFWNNQIQGTLDLQEHGILLPYRGAGYERIPSRFKNPDGHWVGFAGRLRVFILNTKSIPNSSSEPEKIIAQLLQGDLSRMAVAKPLYGTTRSHYTTLWHHWGKDKLIEWHHDMRRRNVREATGNAMVKNLVATGKCDIGWTDTDDYFVAVDSQQPVTAIPFRLDDGATICIPNSVAIIRGSSRVSRAQQLVDFLLSEETEIALSHCKSRQIPLGDVPEDKLPAEVRQLKRWAQESCDMVRLGAAREECLSWLKSEYLQ
jgi:iron(III) transport system substrate-binding protein